MCLGEDRMVRWSSRRMARSSLLLIRSSTRSLCIRTNLTTFRSISPISEGEAMVHRRAEFWAAKRSFRITAGLSPSRPS